VPLRHKNKKDVNVSIKNSELELCVRMYKIISEVYYTVSLLCNETLLFTYQMRHLWKRTVLFSKSFCLLQ
jgi:hypothetical protein